MASEVSHDRLVPFRWPSAWTESALSLLAGGSINCLVFENGGHPAAEAARRAGFSVRELGALAAAPLAKADWSGTSPILTLNDVAWPQIKPVERGAAADSGPTAAPWIDSTSWMVRLAASRAPGKQIWLAFDPPKATVLNAQSYRLALADCAATGARWILSLDQPLAAALAAGNAQAKDTWSVICETLAFFEQRAAWRPYPASGPLAVVSSFSGDNEFMGTEFLNLAARRNLLYRVIDRTRAESADFGGLRAVLWIDSEAPRAPVRAKLAAFAQAGGLIIAPRAVASGFQAGNAVDCPVSGYELRVLGKGRVAAPVNDWDDPYFVVLDTHNLVSRRHDPVRMFNASSMWVHYAVQPKGAGSLIQLVNFASRPGSSVSLRIQYAHRSVQIHTLESGGPKPLPAIPVEGQKEYRLPAFSTYAALEVSA